MNFEADVHPIKHVLLLNGSSSTQFHASKFRVLWNIKMAAGAAILVFLIFRAILLPQHWAFFLVTQCHPSCIF